MSDDHPRLLVCLARNAESFEAVSDNGSQFDSNEFGSPISSSTNQWLTFAVYLGLNGWI